MKKKIIKLLVLLLGIYLVVGLSRDLYNLIGKGGRTGEMEKKVEELSLKNLELKEELEYVESEKFVEKEARDRLNMAKEGEVIVVLPEDLAPPDFQKPQSSNEDLANWQQWLKLFL
jgi:cell division protein FtsB